jgi:hypothetical protein
MLLGLGLYLLGYISVLSGKNVFTFCLFYASNGIYEIMFNGVKEVLVYNNIKYLGIEDNFVVQKNIAKILQYVTLLLSMVLSAVVRVKGISMNYPIILDMITLVLYITTVCFIEEHRTENVKKLSRNIIKTICIGFKYIFKHSSLEKIILFRIFWFSLYRVFLLHAPKFYLGLGIWPNKKNFISFIPPMQVFCGALIQYLLISYYASRKNARLDATLFLISSFSALLASAIYRGSIACALLMIYFPFTMMGEIVFFTRLQRFAPSKIRGTVISICNFFTSIVRFSTTVALGYIIKTYSNRTAFLIVTSIFATGAIIFYISIFFDKHIERVDKRIWVANNRKILSKV